MDGKELTASEFLASMRSEELAGNEEWSLERQGLIRMGDVYVTPETASEIRKELAA
jgi:hypothetical protein